MEIKEFIIDRREPNADDLAKKFTEHILERREKTGLGSRLTLPVVGELEHGDYQFIVTGFNKDDYYITIERKTIVDGLNNWHPAKSALGSGKVKNRLDTQIYDMLNWERTDMGILLIEHCYIPKKVFQNERIWNFYLHLNYLETCVLPVVRTKSKPNTMRYLVYMMEKILTGDFMVFKRPLELIDEGNMIKSMLCSIPDVGPEIAENIMAQFGSFKIFLTACEKHLQLHREAETGVISKAKMDRSSPLMKVDGIGRKMALQIAVFMTGKW